MSRKINFIETELNHGYMYGLNDYSIYIIDSNYERTCHLGEKNTDIFNLILEDNL